MGKRHVEKRRFLETGLKTTILLKVMLDFFSGGSCTTNGNDDCGLDNQICVDDSDVASPDGGGANDVCDCDTSLAEKQTDSDAVVSCVLSLGKV